MTCDAFSAFNARRSPGLSGADLQPIYWAKTPQVNVVQYTKDLVRRFIQNTRVVCFQLSDISAMKYFIHISNVSVPFHL